MSTSRTRRTDPEGEARGRVGGDWASSRGLRRSEPPLRGYGEVTARSVQVSSKTLDPLPIHLARVAEDGVGDFVV
jgi:hypothetical protein